MTDNLKAIELAIASLNNKLNPNEVMDIAIKFQNFKIDEPRKPFEIGDPFIPLPFQQLLLDHVSNFQLSIILAARQSGITTTLLNHSLDICEEKNKSVHIICANFNNASYKKAIIEKLLSNRCDYPEIRHKNKFQISFENDSNIDFYAAARTRENRSRVATHLIMDEAAYFPHSLCDDLKQMEAMAPNIVIASSAGQKNGFFYESYQNKKYNKLVLPYHCMPGRDIKWKLEMIERIGEAGFAKEYDCEFYD
jgi:thymidine kinase